MKKIILFFIGLLLTTSSFAQKCDKNDFAFFNISNESFASYISDNQLNEKNVLSSFHCWEIPHIIEKNITSSKQYCDEVQSFLNEENNNPEKFSTKYFRAFGSLEDLKKFSSSNGKKESINRNIEKLRYIKPQSNFRIYEGKIMYKKNLCANIPNQAASDLSKLPLFRQPFSINPQSLSISSFAGEEVGNIEVAENSAKLIIGTKEYNIAWNPNCIETVNGNKIIEFLTGATLVKATFKTISNITKSVYKALIDLSYILLPLILMIWIFGQGIKPFNLFNFFSKGKTDIPDMPNIFKELLDMMLYIGLFYGIFAVLNPVDIVNLVIEPILTLGIMVGNFVLSLTEISNLPEFNFTASSSYMFENTANHLVNYLQTIGIINGKIILIGLAMLPSWKFLAGIVLIIAFAKITWVYLKTFWDIFLDLILVVVFLPIWAMMWIFPETRSDARAATLDKIIEIAYKFAYLPFIILVNYVIIKAMLIKDLSLEQIERLNLNDQSTLTSLARDMSFGDALFFGLVVTFIFTDLKTRIEGMLNVKTSDTFAGKVKGIYDKNKKRYENIKKQKEKRDRLKKFREIRANRAEAAAQQNAQNAAATAAQNTNQGNP